jgi:prepilin-type N-terminal cleavage/methylation domain-containing protein
MMRPSPADSRARAGTRGYTVIEILMAMTVMAIGGAAVMTMQKTSVAANLDARKADVGNAIARTWVERLQRDAMQWTLPSPLAPTTNNIAKAAIIAQINSTGGNWFLPNQELGTSPSGTETMSPAFDILGRDLPGDQMGSAVFCVNVRLKWLTNGNLPSDLIRADVRVIWPMGITNSLPSFCSAAVAAATPDPNDNPGILRETGADGNQLAFHALYVTTVIRENAAP